MYRSTNIFLVKEYLEQQSGIPRNSYSKFQGNTSVLKCDRVWLFPHNLLSKQSSRLFIIRRSGF